MPNYRPARRLLALCYLLSIYDCWWVDCWIVSQLFLLSCLHVHYLSTSNSNSDCVVNCRLCQLSFVVRIHSLVCFNESVHCVKKISLWPTVCLLVCVFNLGMTQLMSMFSVSHVNAVCSNWNVVALKHHRKTIMHTIKKSVVTWNFSCRCTRIHFVRSFTI